MPAHIYKNNEQQGPYEDSVIVEGLSSGRFLPADLACLEGSSEWVALATLFPGAAGGESMLRSEQGIRHQVPKRLSCGAITPWKLDPILNTNHIVVGLLLMLLFCSGLFYFITLLLLRSNSNTRAKVCPRCGARNMWTFQY
jgi:hypothetical protein